MAGRPAVHFDDVDPDGHRSGAHVRHQTEEVTVVVRDHGWGEDRRRVSRPGGYHGEPAGQQERSEGFHRHLLQSVSARGAAADATLSGALTTRREALVSTVR